MRIDHMDNKNVVKLKYVFGELNEYVQRNESVFDGLIKEL